MTLRPRAGPEVPLSRLIRLYVTTRRDAGELSPVTAPAVRCRLLCFAELVGGPASTVTRGHVEAHVGRPGLAAATRRQELSAIRTFFRWLVLNGHVEADPTTGIPAIREPRRLPRGLRPDQVDALLEVCPDTRARLIVLLEVRCGLRAVEVSRLAVEDIDRADRTILARGKGGHERIVPVPSDVWAALEAYLCDHPGAGPLIRSYNDPTAGLCAAHVVNLVGGWFRRAGIASSGHALRHTVAGQLVRDGVDVRSVQVFLGHSNLSTTSRYLGPANTAALRGALEALGVPGRDGPAPEPALPVDVVATLGTLIDVVADLRRTVDAIAAGQSDQATGMRRATPEVDLVACDVCGQRMRRSDLRWHRERHCPECGELVGQNVGAHRARKHGVRNGPAPATCTWDVAHEHNPSNRCLCPLCGRDRVGVAPGTMAEHLARPHVKCPDCDRCFIDLARHRRLAHPWATAAPTAG